MHCKECKKEVAAPPKVSEIIEKELADLNPIHQENFPWKKPFKIYRPVGCKFCGNKGIKGRIALYEILQMTDQLEEMIVQGFSDSKIEAEARRQGMITIKQDGINKSLKGIISFEGMLRAIEE